MDPVSSGPEGWVLLRVFHEEYECPENLNPKERKSGTVVSFSVNGLKSEGKAFRREPMLGLILGPREEGNHSFSVICGKPGATLFCVNPRLLNQSLYLYCSKRWACWPCDLW